MNEPTSAEWVIGEWVTLDRELHPFEALELATVIEAVKLHVLHGWPRWWAWTFASLVAEIAIGILEAAAGELVIVDHDVGETYGPANVLLRPRPTSRRVVTTKRCARWTKRWAAPGSLPDAGPVSASCTSDGRPERTGIHGSLTRNEG